jgi:hypothetical protein
MKKIIIVIFCIVIIIGLGVVGCLKQKTSNEISKEEVNDLKEDIGVSGDTDLYQIQTEYDGNKTLDIKPEIQYKVAFAGIIEQKVPKLENVDTIFNKNYPKNYGVWIDSTSREKFLTMLKENTNNEYEITEEGFLKIKKENNSTDIDNSLKEIIQSNKRYIITISGIYYEIDRVTGEILDNFYEDMDPMQATKSVDNKDDIIIYLTTNTEKRLTTKEILYELISYK